jgi:hypothetical protein
VEKELALTGRVLRVEELLARVQQQLSSYSPEELAMALRIAELGGAAKFDPYQRYRGGPPLYFTSIPLAPAALRVLPAGRSLVVNPASVTPAMVASPRSPSVHSSETGSPTPSESKRWRAEGPPSPPASPPQAGPARIEFSDSDDEDDDELQQAEAFGLVTSDCDNVELAQMVTQLFRKRAGWTSAAEDDLYFDVELRDRVKVCYGRSLLSSPISSDVSRLGVGRRKAFLIEELVNRRCSPTDAMKQWARRHGVGYSS